MKIGVLTLPLHTNYGGILQAYALQTVLERMGHKVVIIRKEERNFSRAKDWIKMMLLNLFPIMKKRPQLRTLYKSRNIMSFINNRFSFSGQKKLKNKALEVIIAGSDQIWRKWGESWDIYYYFLSFAKDWNIKRYSYAASFGLDYWDFSVEETNEIKNLLERFDRISVRESDAKRMLFEKFGICSEVYLDPTLLLTKADYISEVGIDDEKTIKLASYILDIDEEKNQIVSSLSSFLKYPVHKIGNTIVDKKNREVLPSVENWISDFAMAENIVTDSFHGTAFSINFNKNFVVLSNNFRGQSRLISILSLFNLENRLATNKEDALKILQSPIDWDSVNEKLGKERMKAMSFLMELC